MKIDLILLSLVILQVYSSSISEVSTIQDPWELRGWLKFIQNKDLEGLP
jgi:hypothetical protein